MNRDKMISTAKFMNTGAKVAGGIFGAAAIVCAIFAVLVAVLGERMIEIGSFTLELGYYTFHLTEDFPVDMGMMKWCIGLGLIGVAVICFLVKRATVHLRSILTPMEEGRPFEPGTPVSLRKIAWIMLIGGAVAQILAFAEGFLQAWAYPVDAVFSTEAVKAVEYNFTLDLSFVWIACLILFLSYIFSYGQSLQQESDETL